MSGDVLLVIDVQRVYMEPSPMVTRDGDDLIEKCNQLIRKARADGVPVLFVRHMDRTSPEDEALTGIHPNLNQQASDPVVTKGFGSAFFKTDLEEHLANVEAKRLVVCGLATFGCVNATVMCALCKGYDVVVAEDAHGTPQDTPTPAAEMISVFNGIWKGAGAVLRPTAGLVGESPV